MIRHYIVATAGHVDHGKSALVKALTGTDPDRLPEEKARKITIDLGFAELKLLGPNGDEIHAGIIDVPGHEDFVRNMIAGVGSVDLALIVVAADDGWMQQSEEHLQILDYLGVEHAVIALTKSDLGQIDAVTTQIQERLRETTFFAHAPVIPTSIRTGEGIGELRSAIGAALATVRPRRDISKPRLFVDRVFTLHGIGTVITGTLTGGKLGSGQSVMIQPQNLVARIRSLQSHGVALEFAHPGMRTALNLPDIAVDQISRGDVITNADLGSPSSSLVVRLSRSRRRGVVRPLKNGSSVYVHHGTSRVAAKIGFLGNDEIVRLNLASPVFAFTGDRFVIRDGSERHTIAGGIVLDPQGEGRPPARLDTGDVEACLRAEFERRGFIRRGAALTKSHFSADEIAAALQRLERRQEVVVCGEIAADATIWRELRLRAIALIDMTHQRNSERIGMDLTELRSRLPNLSDEKVFDALITDLCANGFARSRSTIARAAHSAALPIALQSTETRIREVLSQKPFDPPARKEIEPDRQSQQVLRFLVEAGEAIELGPSLVLLRDNFEQMKSAVVDFISRNGPATVSELRQALESSRRIMVPLLERLDRDGVTRRMGDQRILAEQIAAIPKTGLE